MKLIKYFIGLTIIMACKKTPSNVRNITSDITNTPTENLFTEIENYQNQILVFNEVLIYTLEHDEGKTDFWFYVNREENLILYMPQDDMIEAVISYPNGKYQIFATDEFGKKVKCLASVEKTNNNNLLNVLNPLNNLKITKNLEGVLPIIESQGFTLKYTQENSQETIYTTNQINLNSRQLYGFTRLEGDSKLSYHFDFLNVLNKNQWVTHSQSAFGVLELLEYSFNYYEINLNDYKSI